MKQLDFGTVLSLSLARFARSARITVPISIVFGLALGIVGVLVGYLLAVGLVALGLAAGATAGGVVGTGIAAVLAAVAVIFFGVALHFVNAVIQVHAVAQVEAGEHPTTQDVVSDVDVSGAFATGIVAAALLALAGVTLAFPPLGIPLLAWLGTRWSLAPAVAHVEGLRGTAALDRSAALVAGVFWPVFAALLVLGIGAAIASGMLSAVFDALLPGDLLERVGRTVAAAAFLPLVIAGTQVLYTSLSTGGDGHERR